MSLLSMVEARLPPGFRFHPRDEELICDYVAPKVAGDVSRSFFGCQMLIEVDLNKCEPWDLPGLEGGYQTVHRPDTCSVDNGGNIIISKSIELEMAQVGEKDWYFFSLKDRKYATGQRANRATPSGYWKATGKDKPVVRKGMPVGMRKTLVFYRGRAPKGKKTEWVMHEFRMESPGDPPKPHFEEDWVLCKVFNKSREISIQPSAKAAYEDTGPSSLPNLSNSYITFNQTLPDLEVFEQVPCFSSFHPNSEPISLFPLLERNLPTKGLAQRSSDSFLSGTGLPSVWNPY